MALRELKSGHAYIALVDAGLWGHCPLVPHKALPPKNGP